MTAECHKIHAGQPEDTFRLYNWDFYVYHPTSQRHIIWDLGLTSVGLRPSMVEGVPLLTNVLVERTRTIILQLSQTEY